jgi:uncharacterized OB-fold protein
MTGVVYTETTVYSPPEAYAAEAPYQIAIVELDQGGRLTARIEGPAVSIGDRVRLLESRAGVSHFTRE